MKTQGGRPKDRLGCLVVRRLKISLLGILFLVRISGHHASHKPRDHLDWCHQWRSLAVGSIVYANDGFDDDRQNGVDDPSEVWTATYGQDSIDNDNDGATEEADDVH